MIRIEVFGGDKTPPYTDEKTLEKTNEKALEFQGDL